MADVEIEAQSVDPEDRLLIEKLAKLQGMFNQIGGLRTLLPQKLINATRFALEAPNGPNGFNPEKLAGYLQAAARQGSTDIQRFKKDWHSEDVRELWQSVNSSELPQGIDAWLVDYVTLLKQIEAAKSSQGAEDVEGKRPVLSIEERAKVLDEFKERHPTIKVHVVDEGQSLPLDLEVAKMTFRVVLNDSVGGAAFKVIAKPDTTSIAMLQDILRSLENIPKEMSLADVLDLTASYQDIKERPCDKCKKLVRNGKLQLPFVRKPENAQGRPTKYFAYHQDCL